jgi:hypothetical protein
MGLRLTRQAVVEFASATEFPVALQHTWPLRVTATVTPAGEFPPEIFVYHAANLNGKTEQDEFVAVASVQQLDELPVGNAYSPDILSSNNLSIPFYRKNEVLFHCRSAAEAEELWEKIKADAEDLVANYLATTALLNSDQVEFELE